MKTTFLLLLVLFAIFFWPASSEKKERLRAKFRKLTTYLLIAIIALWTAQLIWLAADYFMK